MKPQQETLRRAYRDALAAQSGVGFAREKEVTAVLSSLGSIDFAESDAALAKAAFAAGTLYALFVSVRLDDDGALSATGRVVREDGMAMAGSSARVAWDSARSQEKARELLLQLLAGLKLEQLPGKLEVASSTGGFSPSPLPASSSKPVQVPVANTADAPNASLSLVSPSLPPPEESSTQAQLGKIGLVGGAGIAAVGALLLGLAAADSSRLTPDADGALPLSQRPIVQAAVTKQAVGIGLLIGGAVVAGVGAGLWFFAPKSSVSISAAPIQSGAAIFVGGAL